MADYPRRRTLPARASSVLSILACLGLSAAAATAAPPTVELAPPPPAAQASEAFDPEAATAAYLATLSAEQRERSDSYFEGGTWLQLWGFLYGLGISALLLATGWSRRMRDRADRLSRRGPVRTLLYWLQYLATVTVLGFPLTVYQGYFREHQYGLATQDFGSWLGDQAKGFGVGLVLGGLLVAALYGVVRRLPRSWWIWGAAVTVVFLAFGALIAPVFIAPLFNKYTALADPRVREPILALARANSIPATEVYEMDASRQSTRVSANVSGFLGTERITLNDNLLNRCSLPEIEAVMGHEMGHYVLNHVYEGILELGLVIVGGFAFLRWGFERARARWGERWGISGIGDVAGLPLATAVLAVYFFAMTPIVNTIIRVNEAEADLYGLNASGQPDGFAQVALKLGEYRKLAPGPVEEWLFFDHPSGQSRIRMAMRWKAEHLEAARAQQR